MKWIILGVILITAIWYKIEIIDPVNEEQNQDEIWW